MITINQYQKLINIDDEFNQIAILENRGVEEIENLPLSKYKDLLKKWKPLLSGKLKSKGEKNYINVLDHTLYLKPLNEISMGEFIDLNEFIKKKEIAKVLTIMFQKKTHIYDIDSDEWEKWGGFSTKRSEQIMGLNYLELKNNIDKVFEWREKIINSYFGTDKPVNIDEMTEDERVEYEKELEEDKRKDVYKWEYLLYNLSGGDITKIDSILQMNALQVLNMIKMKQIYKV